MNHPATQWSFTRSTAIDELDALDIRHPLFSARVFLQGAHLASYAPAGQPDWLWLSPLARYKNGGAIRGGIPVCWPWFGDPARNPPEVRRRISTDSAHGFARTQLWQLEDLTESVHEVELSLSLSADETTASLWRGQAVALITFRFTAEGCQVALTTTNRGPDTLAFTQALHTYLPTPDIHETRLRGFDGSEYFDTLRQWETFSQGGPVRFLEEVDRIYLGAPDLTLATPSGIRKLSANGSDSTVVWNPWVTKSKSLSDFPDDAWRHMLCVETANAATDYQVLEPGQSHVLALQLK